MGNNGILTINSKINALAYHANFACCGCFNSTIFFSSNLSQSPFFHLILGTFPLKHNLEFGCKN